MTAENFSGKGSFQAQAGINITTNWTKQEAGISEETNSITPASIKLIPTKVTMNLFAFPAVCLQNNYQ